MNYTFADNINGLKPSAIREILKLSSQPGIIPFSAGNPAGEAFPSKEVAEISNAILEKDPIMALQYSVTEGYAPLREYIAKYMKEKYSVGSEDDDIIITSGAQQVMNLVTKVFVNRGDTIICEDPSFIGSLNAFRSFGANLVGVPVEADGIDLNALENAIKISENVRFLYTIPNFQNPSGVTMSLEKRKAVYEICKKYGVLILEDNPYGEIRFSGEDIPTIKSMDTDGIVIYAGSFSKVLSPGMRVGYAIANKEIMAKLTVCKQTDDVHTTLWSQLVSYKFVTEYDFEAHLEKIRSIYRRKANLCMRLADEHLKPAVDYYPVEGGLFLWCKLPENIDMMEFTMKALENKVAVVPGTAFSVDTAAKSDRIRINYSTPTDEQIINGMEILGKLLK
ncbi:MAG: PLP-dependent aminotransferase family protein [Ruminococcaceae bacterium]|nr:PLP-dependent aminotransferase family protein [Oscillospiraceae bacterium]